MPWRTLTLALGLATLIAAATGVARVRWLERQELRVVQTGTLTDLGGFEAEHVRLAEVRLARDQHVTFELCGDDGMTPERWAGAMALAVWRPGAGELMTRTELTDAVLAQVRRNASRGCLTIGRGVIAEDDVYAVEALFDSPPAPLADVPLTLTVQARRPLGIFDLGVVLAAWLAALTFVLALAGWRPKPQVEPLGAPKSLPRSFPEARALGGVLLLAAGFLATGFLPSGAALALGSGVTLAALEVSLAFALTLGPGWRVRSSILALHRPTLAAAWLPAAVAAGLLLWMVALAATSMVPSTGRSAVSLFVSWPSGLLSFASLAVLVPLAEELFFRGFVYGVLAERSRALAFLGGWLLFVLAHAPQTWGQWGALVAIFVTGLVLTALRWASGSTLVPALAHLVYNGALALSAVM